MDPLFYPRRWKLKSQAEMTDGNEPLKDIFTRLGLEFQSKIEKELVGTTASAEPSRSMTIEDLNRARALMQEIERRKPMLVGQQSALDKFWGAYRRAVSDAPMDMRAVFRVHVYDGIQQDRLVVSYGTIPDVKVAVLMIGELSD